VAPAAYPSGCGLWETVYMSGGYVWGSDLTSCSAAMPSKITHDTWLRRLDWWGWDLRDSDSQSVYNQWSLAIDLLDRCSDSNTNSWYAATDGSLTLYGTSYFAQVYDEATLPCGGS
jgi:hypothetical protein